MAESKKVSELGSFDEVGGGDDEYIYMIKEDPAQPGTYRSGKASMGAFKSGVVDPEVAKASQPDGQTVKYVNMIPDWGSFVEVAIKKGAPAGTTLSSVTLPCDCVIFPKIANTPALYIDGCRPTSDMLYNGVYASYGSFLSSGSATAYTYTIVPLLFANQSGNQVISKTGVTPAQLTRLVQTADFDGISPYAPPEGVGRSQLGVYGVPEGAGTATTSKILENPKWKLITDDNDQTSYIQFALYFPLVDGALGEIKRYSAANSSGLISFRKTQLTSSSWGTSTNKGMNGVEIFWATTAYAQLQSDYKIDIRLINFSGIMTD
jgi:hypothetical protein